MPAWEKRIRSSIGSIRPTKNAPTTVSYTHLQGRDALVSAWDNGPHADESTDSLREQLQSLTAKPGKIVRKEGDVEAALAAAANKIEASYELPFLAHATMEPMNCTADVRSNRAEIWAPTQGPDWNQSMVAQVLKLPPKSVVVHTVLCLLYTSRCV